MTKLNLKALKNKKKRTPDPAPDVKPEQTNNDLAHDLEVERLLLTVARKFGHVTPANIDRVVQTSLATFVKFIHADRGYIYFFKNHNKQLELTYQFNKHGVSEKIALHDKVDSNDFSWLIGEITNLSTINITSPDQLPDKATTIKMIMDVEKTKSMLICPIVLNKKVQGLIGFDSTSDNKIWPPAAEHLLKMSADIFIGAISRKRSVESGLRTEQRLRMLFSRSEDVVFISTPKGKILEINPAGLKLFGYTSVAEMSKINVIKDLYADETQLKDYKEALAKFGQVKDFEFTLKRKDGQNIFVLETTTAVRNKSGDIVAYEGIMRDVTEKSQLEKQLFQAQKMESIGLLAGGIAHDFNNILNVINGYAEMSLLNIDESNPLYVNIDNIHKGGKRAEKLIRQLLAFSRKQMIQPKVCSINNIITDLYKMLGRLVEEDINFKLQLENNIGNIRADVVQIQQVLTNMVINASHAIRHVKDKTKFKTITIRTEPVFVDKDFVDSHPGIKIGDYAVISIEDTGIGMDEQTKLKIFDPFFTTKKDLKGTGLGLSTVYGIVKQNDASVYVESEPGQGAIFKIYWPICEETPQDDSRMETQIQFSKHSETILFVEDDSELRNLTCSALKSFGYNVIEAVDGKEAYRMFVENKLTDNVDLLFTDMVMPRMGGQELALKLRKINPNLRVLLCSGYSDSRALMSDTNGNGEFYFLSKPYTLKRMEKKIRTVLQIVPKSS